MVKAIHEPAMDPHQAICDAHHHLWAPRGKPERRYLATELQADIDASGHRVVSTVFMECMAHYDQRPPVALQPVGETRWVDSIAKESADGPVRLCAAIVGYADLMLGADVGEVLDAHVDASTRFRGIRHATAWDSSPDVRNAHTNPGRHQLANSAFQHGMTELTRRNLTFDAWLYHPQIHELTTFARANPNQVIIFDHFGGPLGVGPYQGQHANYFDRWREDIAELGRCDNVVAKLGGLTMPINGFDFHKNGVIADSKAIANALRPYVESMLEAFSPSRCMFESNFPVDRVSCSYGVLWNAYQRLTSTFSDDEKRLLFHDTATKIYRIT
jgi:L-fuconolactonase